MKRLLLVPVIFFSFGLVSAAVNVFALWLLVNVAGDSLPLLLLVAFFVLMPIAAFFTLLMHFCRYCKKREKTWRWFQNVITAIIAVVCTILPYWIF